jgi:hypothetical protein
MVPLVTEISAVPVIIGDLSWAAAVRVVRPVRPIPTKGIQKRKDLIFVSIEKQNTEIFAAGAGGLIN